MDPNKLDFFIKHDQNVLFTGMHGVGKTAMITQAFDRNNLRWRYFSASTMDPWVDFIGVPRQQEDEKGPYLDLVKPLSFRNDEIDALFFDEFNRAHKKVRNAVMELIQFKSINGQKFENLKIIWAAVNPESEGYDVEHIDPAQLDRFHVSVYIPYELNRPYFTEKFGAKVAGGTISWWNNLPKEVKNVTSPRRVDYALDYFMKGGSLDDILNEKANVAKLLEHLTTSSLEDQVKLAVTNNDTETVKDLINNTVNIRELTEVVASNSPVMKYVFDNDVVETGTELWEKLTNHSAIKAYLKKKDPTIVFKANLFEIDPATEVMPIGGWAIEEWKKLEEHYNLMNYDKIDSALELTQKLLQCCLCELSLHDIHGKPTKDKALPIFGILLHYGRLSGYAKDPEIGKMLNVPIKYMQDFHGITDREALMKDLTIWSKGHTTIVDKSRMAGWWNEIENKSGEMSWI